MVAASPPASSSSWMTVQSATTLCSPAPDHSMKQIATAPREIKEITAEVADWTERQGISVGLLAVYIAHTSASLLIQENASPDVLRDLDAFLRRIVPEDV